MSGQFARLRGALDRVGTTTPGTIVGVFAEDLTAIMNHYVEVVREAAELKAARAQPAQATSEIREIPAFEPTQAGQVLTDEEIQAAWVEHGLDDCAVEDFARAVEQAVLAKRVPMMREEVKELARKVGYDNATAQERADFINGIRHAEVWHGIVGEKGGA